MVKSKFSRIKMKVTEHIKNAKGKTLFSFEIIPPKKGNSIQQLYNNIDPLMEFKPPSSVFNAWNSSWYFANAMNSVVHTGVKSAG